jgi:drug/metabolite transporter (DMT)-like permease
MTEHTSAPAPRRAPPVAYLMLLATGIFYGLQLTLTKVATTGGIPPVPLTFWSALGAGLTLFIINGFRGHYPKIDFLHIRAYLLVGVVGFGAPYTLLAYVAPQIPAGIVAITLALNPMIVYGLALLVRMEGFRRLRFLGLALGFAGMMLIVAPDASLPEPGMALWVLICLAGPTCFALAMVGSDLWRPPETDSLALAGGALLTGALFCLLITIVTGDWWFFEGSFDWADASIPIIAAILVANWTMFYATIRVAGAVFYSTVSYAETLCGIAWGYLILSELHSSWVWSALVLLLGGLYLVNRRSTAGTKPKSNPPTRRNQTP